MNWYFPPVNSTEQDQQCRQYECMWWWWVVLEPSLEILVWLGNYV